MSGTTAQDIIRKTLKITDEEVANKDAASGADGDAASGGNVADADSVAPEGNLDDKNVDPAKQDVNEPGAAADAPIGEHVADAVPDPLKPAEQPQVIAPAEIDDVALLELLKKRGIDVSNLEDLQTTKVLTNEEVEQQKKDKRESAVRYGLENKMFSTDEMSSYAVDQNKDARDIAYGLFEAEQKNRNPQITPEEVGERFAEKYGEDLDDGNWRKEEGQQMMAHLKEMYLDSKYDNIRNIESRYDEDYAVKKAAKNYKSTVDTIFGNLSNELSFDFADTDSQGGEAVTRNYKYTFGKEEIEAIKAQFLHEDRFNAIGSEKVDPVKIKGAVDIALKSLSFSKIVTNIARSYASDRIIAMQADRHNVMPEAPGGSATNTGKTAVVQNPIAQKIIDQIQNKK